MTDKKTSVLFATFGKDASGPERWLRGLLEDGKFQSEVSYSVWHVPDLYRGVFGKVKLLQDCRSQIRSKPFQKIYINLDLNLAALLVMCFRLLGFKALIVHSRNSEYYANDRKLKPRTYQAITRLLVAQKIAVSSEAASAMYGDNVKHVTIIPSFIDFESLWQKSLQPVSSLMSGEHPGVIFGCVGRLAEQKNQELIIRALAKMNNVGSEARLILIGEGHLRARYEKLAEELGLQERVILTGEVESVAPYYAGLIDVLLVPSLFEGQGRIVAEAQLFGLPVVVSRSVPHIGFLTDEAVYRVDSYREQDWARAMEERVRMSPEKNNVDLAMALAHPKLAMKSGVDRVLSVINTYPENKSEANGRS